MLYSLALHLPCELGIYFILAISDVYNYIDVLLKLETSGVETERRVDLPRITRNENSC